MLIMNWLTNTNNLLSLSRQIFKHLAFINQAATIRLNIEVVSLQTRSQTELKLYIHAGCMHKPRTYCRALLGSLPYQIKFLCLQTGKTIIISHKRKITGGQSSLGNISFIFYKVRLHLQYVSDVQTLTIKYWLSCVN